MTPPTVDRFRYPWRRLVPGELHTAVLHWQGDLDQSAHDFELVMVDAYTATPVTGVDYVIDDVDAATGTITATATIPAELDTAGMYELRWLRDAETIIAGPVLFAPSTIPQVTP